VAKTHAIVGISLLDKVASALLIDPGLVRRIVLDLPYDDVAVAYVELLMDQKMLEIEWDMSGVVIHGGPGSAD